MSVSEHVLDVDGLRKVYEPRSGNAPFEAISNVSFTVNSGEFVCVIGPSGAGKSTLLRCMSGLLPVTSGSVRFNGQPLTGVPDGLSIVFQDYSRSLFPWLSVAANVAVPLKVEGVKRPDRDERIHHVLASVGLPSSGKMYPWQLSGGMQQRVALARSLVRRPSLLLMDEPFASVDAQSRFNLEDLVLQVRKEYDTTIVLVTHDIDEAIYLGDKVVVLSNSPSVVLETIAVPFGAERNQASTRSTAQFGEMRTRLLGLLSPGST